MALNKLVSVSHHEIGQECLPKPEPTAVIDHANHTLLERFNTHFHTLPANTAERIRSSQAIRYQVYCIEHPHENADSVDKTETDEFDTHAVHSLLVHSQTNAPLGTVRLVLPIANDLERSFPVQRVMDAESLAVFETLPLHTTAEMSRFSISRLARRAADKDASPEHAAFISNSGPLMRLGLMQSIIRMSLQHGITHLSAAMEPTLLRMLSAMGIHFRPIGPLVEYHGLRQPCYCVIADALEVVKRERPAFWHLLTDGGAVHRRETVESVH